MQPGDLFRNKEVELRPIKVKPSVYDVNYSEEINGVLSAWAIPIKCYILDDSKTPPVISIVWAHVTAFQNNGVKGDPDYSPITPDVLDNPSNIDLIGSESVTKDEPYNEYVVNIKDVLYTVRAQTTLTGVSSTGRLNNFGDPVLAIKPNTSFSLERRSKEKV